MSGLASVEPEESGVKEAGEKPLFIALNTEYFEMFADGRKTEELRRWGTRWNESQCRVGRTVTLSKGYGRKSRLTGKIWKFKKQLGSTFGSTYKAAIKEVFGTLDLYIACISITDIRPVSRPVVRADLTLELLVECPECGRDTDLLTETALNDEGALLDAVISDKAWKVDPDERLTVELVTCGECGCEFSVKGVDW